ncbi:hypothetical protein ACJD0Z_14475 [Flavobacteriaceae bacterium M23B6Z8]
MNKIITSGFIRVLLLLILPMMVSGQQAQNAIGPKSYEVQKIPASPEVAALGTFGNLPVNKYNGTVNVRVPIYQIDFEGLTIPVNLSYNTGGIRVNQDASWVGLGWNLSEGITITREVNDFEDIRNADVETESVGWIFTENYLVREEVNNFEPKVASVHLKYLDSLMTLNKPRDMQPDLFTVNTPSGSCKFYLPKKASGENVLAALILDQRNFKITYTISTQEFQVIDPNGFTYHFTEKEKSTGYSSWDAAPGTINQQTLLQGIPPWSTNQTRYMISAWKPSKIVAPFGQELFFTYESGFFLSYPSFSESYNFTIHNTPINGQTQNFENTISAPNAASASMNAFHTLHTSTITGDFGSVTFTISNNRDDLFSVAAFRQLSGISGWTPSIQPHAYDPKKLQQITVRNSQNEIVTSAQFFHSYFNQDEATTSDKEKYLRLKLDSLHIQDQRYHFQYKNSNSLPPKDTKGTDFWGFYNGLDTNPHRIPSMNRFFEVHTPSWNNNQNYECFYKQTGVSRKSDPAYASYGMLEKVTYPTGGSTEMHYEGHTVNLEQISYNPSYQANNVLNSSGLSSSEAYNFPYQYLKLANDPTYSLFGNNSCQMSNSTINTNAGGFTINDMNFCNGQAFNVRVAATLNCTTGCNQGVNPSGPAVWLENITTGDIQNLFYYDNQFDTNTYTVTLEEELLLMPGSYKLHFANWTQNSPFLVVANASAQLTWYEDNSVNAPVSEDFTVGGLRIKQLINKDYDGTFISAETFSYEEDNGQGKLVSSGKLMDELIFHSKGNGFFEYTPENTVDFQDHRATLHSDNRIRTNPSASGQMVGYSRVMSKKVDASGNSNGSVVTRFINKPNDRVTRFIGCTPQLDSNNSNSYQCNNYACLDAIDDPCVDFQTYYNTYNLNYGDVYILGAPPITYEYQNGNVLEETIMNANNQVQRKTVNEYTQFRGGVFAYPDQPILYWTGNVFPITHPYEVMATEDLNNNKLYKLKKTTTYEYLDGTEVNRSTDYFYDNVVHYNLTRTQTVNSQGVTMTSRAYYPQDLTDPFMADLINANRVNQAILTESFKGTAANPEATLINRQKSVFATTTSTANLVLESQVLTQKGNTAEDTRILYEKYDDDGTLLQYRTPNGIQITLIWAYNGQYPVAEIKNASFTEVATALGYTETQLKNFNETNISLLDGLRATLPQAMVTTYQYKPLVGMTQMTDPRGLVTTYEYDAQNRLKIVRDHQGRILSQNSYNYRNQ